MTLIKKLEVVMKKLLISLFLFLLCSCTCYAIVNNLNTDYRRGCCSHHGGVCGCSGGRAVCCDGTYSPSCGCD